MKRINFILLLITLFIGCSPGDREKGDGNIVIRDHQLEKFTKVEVNGNFVINFKKTSEPVISITTDENLHPFITINQSNEVVSITAEKEFRSKKPVGVTIGYDRLLSIKSSGSSIIKNDEQIRGGSLTMEMAGAGTVDLLLDVDTLKANISGAGVVKLKGKATFQKVDMSGAGGLEAYDLITRNSTVNISGIGGAAIFVQDTLQASVSGVGGISYKGNPKEVQSDISGLGTIKNMGRKDKI